MIVNNVTFLRLVHLMYGGLITAFELCKCRKVALIKHPYSGIHVNAEVQLELLIRRSSIYLK